MPKTIKKTSSQEWSVSLWKFDEGYGDLASFASDPEAALREAIANTPDAPPINGIIVDPAFKQGAAVAGMPITYHVDSPPEKFSYWFIFGPPQVKDA